MIVLGAHCFEGNAENTGVLSFLASTGRRLEVGGTDPKSTGCCLDPKLA